MISNKKRLAGKISLVFLQHFAESKANEVLIFIHILIIVIVGKDKANTDRKIFETLYLNKNHHKALQINS